MEPGADFPLTADFDRRAPCDGSAAEPPGRTEELRAAATKPPATQRRPSGRAPPAPPPPAARQPRVTRGSVPLSAAPLLTAVTRRPEDHARLRRLRTPTEQPQEPRGAPPAVGVRLWWHPESMEGAGKAGLEAALGSEAGMELLGGARRRRPSRSDTKLQPLHGHAGTQPLHSDTELQPLPAHAAVQPEEFPHRRPAPPEALRDLLARLGSALPAPSWRFHAEPLLEPAATDLDLTAGRSQQQPGAARKTPGAPPRPRQLLHDYRRFLSAAGSDFLHAIFNLSSADGDEEPPDERPWGTAEPPAAARLTAEPPPAAPTPSPEELQHRLHRLWAALQLPAAERLAMATKYGPAAARPRLKAALELWEEAAALIRRRERLLALLEGLELRTSDPDRFFQRRPGLPSSAALRGETRARRRLNAEVLRCEEELRGKLRRLREEFGDAVTLKGRGYEEKLRRDRAEMLYRLQQGRRAAAMGGIVRSEPGRR